MVFKQQIRLALKRFKLPRTKKGLSVFIVSGLVLVSLLSLAAVALVNSQQAPPVTTTPETTKPEPQKNVTAEDTQATPQPPSSPSQTSPPPKPVPKPTTTTSQFGCASKTSDNSYHYCVINLSSTTVVNVQVTLDSHAPADNGFIEWLRSDQVTCTQSVDCSVSAPVLASGSLSASGIIQAPTQTQMTVKAQNYLVAQQCGIGCLHPVPREQYSFNGFSSGANNSLTLSYKYQCTNTYTTDTNNEYPWLPGIKPTGCNP